MGPLFFIRYVSQHLAGENVQQRAMIAPPFNPSSRDEFTALGPDSEAVWRALVTRQRQAVQAYGASAFLRQLRRLDSSFCQHGLPDLVEIARHVNAATGWTVNCRPRHAASRYDFTALAQRTVGVSTWLRDRRSFEHPTAPDLFHDVFGRLPALMCADFADLMQLIGQIGMQLPSDTLEFHQLQRVCYRLIESSLVPEPGDSASGSYKLFGASLVSDYQASISAHAIVQGVDAYHFNALMAPDRLTARENAVYKIPSWKQVAEDLMCWFTARKSSSRPGPLCSGTVQCS